MTPEMLQAGYEVIRTRTREIQLTDWQSVLPEVYAAMKNVDPDFAALLDEIHELGLLASSFDEVVADDTQP